MLCLICGKEYKKITKGHLDGHNITVSEYKEQYKVDSLGTTWNKGLSINPDSPSFDSRIASTIEKRNKTMLEKYGTLSMSQFRNNYNVSDETREKMSQAAKKRWLRERDKIIDAQNRGKKDSELFRRVQSEQMKKQADRQWNDPVWRERFRNEIHPKMIAGWKSSEKWHSVITSEEYRKKQGDDSRKRWQEREYKNKVVKNMLTAVQRKPNDFEQEIEGIIQKNNLPFSYVGDGKVVINGLCPDFICPEHGLVIACYGCYWHGCPEHFPKQKKRYKRSLERIKRLEFNGYKVLVIWEHELKDKAKLVKKLRVFTDMETDEIG